MSGTIKGRPNSISDLTFFPFSIISSETLEANGTNLGRDGLWEEEIQIC
jgi:hypothetical protein